MIRPYLLGGWGVFSRGGEVLNTKPRSKTVCLIAPYAPYVLTCITHAHAPNIFLSCSRLDVQLLENYLRSLKALTMTRLRPALHRLPEMNLKQACRVQGLGFRLLRFKD